LGERRVQERLKPQLQTALACTFLAFWRVIERKRAYWKEEEIVATVHGSRLTEKLFKSLK
jgi:hypothetical protein